MTGNNEEQQPVPSDSELLQKWDKVLAFEDSKCRSLSKACLRPLALRCALEMQHFELQHQAAINAVPPDQSCHSIHVLSRIIKCVIPWIRRRYGGNTTPLARCLYELSADLKLVVTPLRFNKFPFEPICDGIVFSIAEIDHVSWDDLWPNNGLRDEYSQLELLILDKVTPIFDQYDVSV